MADKDKTAAKTPKEEVKQQVVTAIHNAVAFSREGSPSVTVINSGYGGAEEKNGQYIVHVNHSPTPFKELKNETKKEREARFKAFEETIASRESALAQEVIERLKEIEGPEYTITAEHMSLLR